MQPDEEERRFTVTITAGLLERIEERRQASGLSRTAWIARALAAAVEPGANHDEPRPHQSEPPRTTADQGDASTGALIVQAQITSLNREIANREAIITRQDQEIAYLRGEVSKAIDRGAIGPPAPIGFWAGVRSRLRRS